MKIALLGYVFSGATLPLAKQLYIKKCEVDCYYLVNRGSRSIESIDFNQQITRLGKIQKISMGNKIYQYMPKYVGIYLCPVLENRRFFVRFHLGGLCNSFNKFFLDHYVKLMIAQKYDVVNIIVQSKYELYIAQKLNEYGIKCVVSFHEVLDNLVGASVLKNIVLGALALNVPIIVHSKKTYDDLCCHFGQEEMPGRIFLIHFGKFDSYLSFGNGKAIEDVKFPYYLYIGTLHPYKGVKFLCRAFQNMSINSKLIIAGGGFDSCLNEVKDDKRFFIINRYIENDELVWLIKNCKAVICPYIAASQSGIVQTAFVFNKPLIATKVGAFEEIIVEGKNGFLANPADSASLVDKISLFEKSKMDRISFVSERYDWGNIVMQYLNLFYTIVN